MLSGYFTYLIEIPKPANTPKNKQNKIRIVRKYRSKAK